MGLKIKKKVVFKSENIAESIVLRDLNELPPSYYIFNDVYLQLSRPVRYRKSEEYVKTCRIDFVVIGPTGLFIICTKDWSGNLLKDVDMAGLVFYIKTANLFHNKLPIYNVAVMLTRVPKVRYGYVHHLSLKQLYWFILRREGRLSKKKVKKIVRWLVRISKKKNIKRDK